MGWAAVHFAFETLNLPRIAAVINPENTRSIQLVERLGMTPGREVELQDKPFLEYYLENDNLV